MGCKFSCCIKKPRKRKIEAPWESLLCDLEPDEKRQANKPDTFKDIIYPVSTPNNLQHISDREEAENVENDPSLHPTFNPLFIQRSRSDMRHMQEKPRSRSHLLETRPLKKSSSCSTIYLDDSTVSHPNYKNTIKCVTMAIYYHIQNRTSNNILDIFDEELHPLSDDPVIDDKIGEPDARSLYRFIWNLFNATQLSPECAIITLVYLERLLTYAEVDIGPSTWKRMVLGAILLASKVWDDQAIWNHDYCMLFKNLTNNDLNDLERHFLQMLQFNTNVPSSVYAKYYFELRTLAAENDLKFNYELLDKERAQRVEAMSKLCDKPMNGIRQWSSDESISYKRRSKAIIS